MEGTGGPAEELFVAPLALPNKVNRLYFLFQKPIDTAGTDSASSLVYLGILYKSQSMSYVKKRGYGHDSLCMFRFHKMMSMLFSLLCIRILSTLSHVIVTFVPL